ncbi:vitamin K epoxide reductase family protein [Leifsonia sp. NPDC080035]|uniref:Vitamin K epoxide reductase family protein n=1 Tax=Leifsonia sp. NPDC080035 TaxID=3143936 RepID=A0AAU7GAF5_9MICO
MSDSSAAADYRRPTALAVFLIIAGAIGFWAAFMLTLDKFALLANANAQLSCNFNVLVGCGKNLGSWQGSLLGFPNPLLGLAGWTATIAVGVGLLAVSGRFARWYWLTFNVGVVLALALVIFLITASLTDLRVLCPWCMVTWVVTIPTFWAVTLYNLKSGNIPLPERARRVFAALYSWIPVITLVSYAIVAILAQIQLDWIHRAFV